MKSFDSFDEYLANAKETKDKGQCTGRWGEPIVEHSIRFTRLLITMLLEGEAKASKLAHEIATDCVACIDPDFLTKSEKDEIKKEATRLINEAKEYIANIAHKNIYEYPIYHSFRPTLQLIHESADAIYTGQIEAFKQKLGREWKTLQRDVEPRAIAYVAKQLLNATKPQQNTNANPFTGD